MTQFLKKSIINAIKFYRKYLSPLKIQSCRFYPTCSEYAIKSLEQHGIIKGSCRSLWRILRCNPFSKGGIDPA
ncbi:MAG: membrane protein insertion efficiency factor YidD [Candidatus Omnitrophica bacterium]|nr:membrane protein insertion efficiency factor YidD [Candidatus Omnitrophota bacterium]